MTGVQTCALPICRTGVEISILERGDSYRPLVELMCGRVIEVNLDGNETLNPWDLPEGEKTPSKEKIAFLKNLTRHMIGDAPGSDTTLVDNVISEAIGRTYKRVGLRYANPVPTFSDLRDELAQWQDEEKMQRAIDEAKLAAIKLRTWTEKGIYSRLFDRHTNIRTDNNWLFFNVEGLGSDPHLETAMSMLIANAMAERASGRSGQPSITVLDECWSLLDSPVLARGRSTVSDRAQTELQRLGHFAGTRRLCWNLYAAASTRPGHREERQHEADRPATWRYERAGKPAPP